MKSGLFIHNILEARKVIICFLMILTALSITFSTGYAADLSLVYRSEKLSADINDIPLRSVLEMLSKKTGIIVYLDPSLNSKKVTVQFEKLPLADGIKKLINPYSSAVVYGKKTGSLGVVSFRVAELKVFDRGKEDASLILIGKKGPSDIETVSKPESNRDVLQREERISSTPAWVKDPEKAAAYHKKVNASVLRSRVRQIMTRIRQLEHKMRNDSELNQREIQEVKEALQNAPENESMQLQAKLAKRKSEMTNTKNRDNNELIKLRSELDQLKKRLSVADISFSNNIPNTSMN